MVWCNNILKTILRVLSIVHISFQYFDQGKIRYIWFTSSSWARFDRTIIRKCKHVHCPGNRNRNESYMQTDGPKHTDNFFWLLLNQPGSDCVYHFPIDLTRIRRDFSVCVGRFEERPLLCKTATVNIPYNLSYFYTYFLII